MGLRKPSHLLKGLSILKTKKTGNSIHIHTLFELAIIILYWIGYIKNVDKLEKQANAHGSSFR